MNAPTHRYPFSALVGQEPLKEALLWIAVDPSIGGILLTGTRGTAKSTAVRALADLLPPLDADTPTPFVELPVGATEDRVIGSLDVRILLAEGKRRFEPGLLARADRGILYVDEVNLLPDHLVDTILDATATGVNVVERDGASFTHPARILLVGTMNPEEGELRPQLLDRFGLCVPVADDDDIEHRIEILERRIAFENDPAAFIRFHQRQTDATRARIARARALQKQVAVTRESLRHAARLAIEAHVEGMRADLAIVRTARAIAALDERTTVHAEDIERAAEPALAHRRREKPAGAPPRPPAPPSPPRTPPAQGTSEENSPSRTSTPQLVDASAKTFDVGNLPEIRLKAPPSLSSERQEEHRHVGRGRGHAAVISGAARIVRTRTTRIAMLATIHAAACERTPEQAGTPLAIDARRHPRFLRRYGRPRRLIVFLIDASGSMAAAARMRAAKGAVCSLLEEAYHRRDAVALIAFRDKDAEVLVPPTRSAACAYRRLRTLVTGGRTPLAQGLRRTHELLAVNARRNPGMRAHVVIVGDARANAPEQQAFQAALAQTPTLCALSHRILCIDTEHGRVRLGNTARLARALKADYQHLDDCRERDLGAAVREWAATA